MPIIILVIIGAAAGFLTTRVMFDARAWLIPTYFLIDRNSGGSKVGMRVVRIE